MNSYNDLSLSYLTFDDVLIVPTYSNLKSRSDAQIETKIDFGNLGYLKIKPVIPANMDTISGVPMVKYITMEKLGIGILHRYMSLDDAQKAVGNIWSDEAFFSVGAINQDEDRINLFGALNCNMCIDIAHGDSYNMQETIIHIRDSYPGCRIIAGNVCTPEAVERLHAWGAHVVKIGIGAGSVCTTRLKTGVGMPQFSALSLCSEVGVQLIADGGFKHIGDISKALALPNVKAVMTGSMFAGTDFSEGYGAGLSTYRGMASKAAQEAFKGKFANEEGIAAVVPTQEVGSTARVFREIYEGIKSSMSYVGARTLDEFKERAKFVRVSSNSVLENHPHILNQTKSR